MARTFSPSEASDVINEYQQLEVRLQEVVSLAESLRAQIKQAATEMAKLESKKLLSEIDVDEINREKQGFRVKTLKDAGINSIADIVFSSKNSLEAINGISGEAAQEIKKAANKIAQTVIKSVKIRLSTDEKTAETTALVNAISKYIKIRKLAQACGKFLKSNSKNVNAAIEDLSTCSGRMKWLFASGEDREKATNAYNFVRGFLESEHGDYGRKLVEEANRIKAIQTNGWKDFEANSVLFFNILEDLCPGVLGTDDTKYGLPDYLAAEVYKEPFYPKGLNCELRGYQKWGVKYTLHQKFALLGDEMGLGKTVQAIATMVSLKNTGATHFMVVCPASVLTNWCREIESKSVLKAIKIHGNDKLECVNQWIKSGGVAVTTFETTEAIALPDKFRFSELIVDEAHYIKNPTAKRSINVTRISRYAERVMFMTGTALENKVDEMVSLIKIIRPDISAKLRGMEALSSAPQFRELVAPVYYRRKRKDVLTELPALTETNEWCTLGKEEWKEYRSAILEENFAKARRVSWNVDDIENSSKAKRLLELVSEAKSEGRKVLVFSFFLDTITKVREILGDSCLEPINGSVSVNRRQEIVDEFNAAPEGTVLAAQIQAGGTGLNIQAASVVILCEPQLKPSIENQAISRAYRMGQTRNVLVYRLLGDDTIDEKIMKMLGTKQRIFNAFADKSSAADQSQEIDEMMLSKIIREEKEKVQQITV